MNAPHSYALSLAEAGRQLGVCPRTVRRMIDRRELGALAIGDNRYKVEQVEIDRYKARHYRPAGPPMPAAPEGGWRLAPLPPLRPRGRRTG